MRHLMLVIGVQSRTHLRPTTAQTNRQPQTGHRTLYRSALYSLAVRHVASGGRGVFMRLRLVISSPLRSRGLVA
jgi:hypothetical protein